jgi:predicted amidophosphoribosyltransferase
MIRKCSLCRELNYIFYQDYAKGISINLCFECSRLVGFKINLLTEVICAKCQKPFSPFKNENICWICKKNLQNKREEAKEPQRGLFVKKK